VDVLNQRGPYAALAGAEMSSVLSGHCGVTALMLPSFRELKAGAGWRGRRARFC